MPLRPEAIDAILRSLRSFLAEASAEDRPTEAVSFPNAEWSMYSAGRSTFLFKRPETAKALAAFRKKFETPTWLAKWSLKYIGGLEAEIIDKAHFGGMDGDVTASITDAVAILDGPVPVYTYVLPITHLILGEYGLILGNVSLKTIDQSCADELQKTYYDIIDTIKNEDEDKARFRNDIQSILGLLKNHACAFVRTEGDVDKAKSSALRDAEPVIDFLQLVTAISEPSIKKIRVTIGGDMLTRQPARLLIASDRTSVHHEQQFAFGHRLVMNASLIERMATSGFGPLIESLRKPDVDRTEYESYLIRSMHWIADAERQERPENKITGYVTAIDMFFATKGEPLTRDVTEGAAMLLGKTLDQRKHIVKRMGDFYEMRSGVSHAGAATFDEESIAELKFYAINFLSTMCSKATQFQKKDQFRKWISDRRLGGEDLEADDPPDSGSSLAGAEPS